MAELKPATSLEQQLLLLRERGMIVDEALARLLYKEYWKISNNLFQS